MSVIIFLTSPQRSSGCSIAPEQKAQFTNQVPLRSSSSPVRSNEHNVIDNNGSHFTSMIYRGTEGGSNYAARDSQVLRAGIETHTALRD
jgi:hypothetical protein